MNRTVPSPRCGRRSPCSSTSTSTITRPSARVSRSRSSSSSGSRTCRRSFARRSWSRSRCSSRSPASTTGGTPRPRLPRSRSPVFRRPTPSARSSSSGAWAAGSRRRASAGGCRWSTTTRIIRRRSRRRSRPSGSAAPGACSSCSSRTSIRGRRISLTSSRRRSRAQMPSASWTSIRRGRNRFRESPGS